MLNADIIVGGFTAGLAILTYFVTRDLSHMGVVFINYVLVIMAVLSGIILVKGFIKPEKITFFESVMERNNVLIGVIILAVYLTFLPFAGFLPASYCFYFAFNMYLADNRFETKNIISSAVISVVVVTLFYFIFHDFLEVPLPTGSWFE